MTNSIVRGMRGLGDNIYQRAWVRQMGSVFLDTPWPELFEDLPGVQFVRPQTSLRTQAKNIGRQSRQWETPVMLGMKSYRIRYGDLGIVAGMTRSFGFSPGVFDLPDFGPPPVSGPYAIVRPVTVRKEWRADARNPLPEYIAESARQLQSMGVRVVSVADLQQGEEWPVGELPPADIQFHRGELSVTQMLSLFQHAGAVVGGIGWIVPAAVASRTPTWVVCGGQGGFNAPERITDHCMDLSNLTFAVPDNFCRCTKKEHHCDKRITGYADRFESWARELDLVAGAGNGMAPSPADRVRG